MTRPPILVLECLVAGTSHLPVTGLQPPLVADQPLQLEREPANKYDRLAVRVFRGEDHLGYLPRDKNETIARLMDAGKIFSARLQSLGSEGKWLKLEIAVWMEEWPSI